MFDQFTRRSAPWVAAAAMMAAGAAQAADAPKKWDETIEFGLQFEGGIIGNTSSPRNRNNFGQLFTDKANDFQLNQVLATVGRPIPKDATGWEFGFKLQGLFGTDARYTRWAYFGKGQTNRYQGDIVEANVLLHAPEPLGGIDFKVGMYSTPMGAETIDPSTNAFYSHSYIFNFGIPLKHTGALSTLHVNDMLDIYAGIDSGVNTTLVRNYGDNNGTAAFMGGVGLNFMGGDLTVLALTHIGPENPQLRSTAPNGVLSANKYNREIVDIVTIWKATKQLTLTAELNYIHDDNPNIVNASGYSANGASAYGMALYAGYAVNDSLTANARLEVFHDSKNFFVGAFPGANDFNNALVGAANGSYGVTGNRGTTYGALTLGVTYKPSLEQFKLPGTLLIRPEIRYDTALNGVKAFNQGRDTGSFTVGSDIVLTF